ncbi:MAG TPA: hypothetical protein VJ725_14510 [Thermoanaerobaculia bacterium]|nr:hypothetical protein [Thermoanaerobaculia bacterium]
MITKHKSLLLAGGFWLIVFLLGALLLMALSSSVLGILVWMISLPIFWAISHRAAANWRNARRTKAGQEDRLSDDPRPRIVYLRSFAEDGSVQEQSSLVSLALLSSPMNLLSGSLIAPLVPEKTYEESISSPLRKIGPVVALAKPGEALPELGAIRIQAPDTEWQQKIISMFKDGRLIVFSLSYVSPSEGLLWELKKATELVPLSRIVISIELGETDRAVRQIRYERLQQLLEPILGQQLPKKIGNKSFLYFNEDGPQLAKSMRAVVAAIKRSEPITEF